jgi:hypothetical protein
MSDTAIEASAAPEVDYGRSAGILELNKALCKAVPKFPEIKKLRTARVRSKKGDDSSYSYHYADLSDIYAAVVPVLCAHGLMLRFCTKPVEPGCLLTAFLTHDSGEWISASLRLPPYSDDQARGSGLSYNKRYLVGILLPIAATEQDDDGQRAVQDEDDQEETRRILEKKEAEKRERESRKPADTGSTRTPVVPLQTREESCRELVANGIMSQAEAENELGHPLDAEAPADPPPDAPTPAGKLPGHLMRLRKMLDDIGMSVEKFMVYMTSERPAQSKRAVRPAGFAFEKLDISTVEAILRSENWRWVVKYGKDGTL